MSVENQPQPNFLILPSDLPVDEFVYKFGPEVCNLKPKPKLLRITDADKNSGCNYCYVFEDYDPDVKPAVMDSETTVRYAERIAEHAATRKLSVVRAVMHGGEALLYPKKIDEAATALRTLLSCELGISLQTNGTIDIEKHIPMLQRHNISVGVSIDGGREAFNRHRRGRKGEDVYDRVVHTANILRRSGLTWGILGVIDPRNNPEEVVEDLAALKPHSISLFPSLIKMDNEAKGDLNVMSLGQWQIRAYERCRDWVLYHPEDHDRPFAVPRWDDYEAVFNGSLAEQQNVAGRAWQEMFMHPQGWGRIDTLAPGARGVHMTAFNPYDHSVDYVLANDPGYIAQRGGRGTLPVACRTCPLVEACGGDYYPHRGNPEKLRNLTKRSSPEQFADAYGDTSPLCSDQKEFLPAIARTVEMAKGYPEGLLTGEIKMPDDISELVPAEIIEAEKITLATVTHTTPEAQRDIEIQLLDPGHIQPLPDCAPRPLALRGLIDQIYHRDRARMEEVTSQLDECTVDWLRCSPDYEVFPFGNDPKKWERETPHHQRGNIVDAIEKGSLQGKLAARTYQALFPSARFYSAPLTAANAVSTVMEHDALLHESVGDAIIMALLNEGQPAMRDVPLRVAKAGGCWLVNGEAVRALASQASSVLGMLVPSASPPPYKPPWGWARETFKVDFFDLPSDMLVLDMPNASTDEMFCLFDEIVETISLYPNPEQLSMVLSALPTPAYLRPFNAPWPGENRFYPDGDEMHDESWRVRDGRKSRV
ncbi:MAG TPA: radical SAM protein [Candidatus Saccharimonadales bacterium]|nr:radical SAM protein [Candidatus Saccharimonadales bacterium]